MRSSKKAATGHKSRKLLIVFIAILVVLIGLLITDNYIRTKYDIKNVYVDGNVHYSDDEIKDMVLSGRFGHNSFILSKIYNNKKVENIPFIETMDVIIEAPDTIRIVVYEKTLAGFVEFLGNYIYFDKDGIVVESSDVKTEGVVEVIGVSFDYVVLHEPLPAKDKDLFNRVLNISQLMTKYGVTAQKLYFKNDGSVVLYKDDIVISLGSEDNLDIKIMNLPPMLENLVGKKGTLHLEKYSEGTGNANFEPESMKKPSGNELIVNPEDTDTDEDDTNNSEDTTSDNSQNTETDDATEAGE